MESWEFSKYQQMFETDYDIACQEIAGWAVARQSESAPSSLTAKS